MCGSCSGKTTCCSTGSNFVSTSFPVRASSLRDNCCEVKSSTKFITNLDSRGSYSSAKSCCPVYLPSLYGGFGYGYGYGYPYYGGYGIYGGFGYPFGFGW